ncbi:transmembrane protein, putative (macronuclear) [Tetrahymena thermophila SB210]|uniref:Transmembrane protein, putative n=1 Tax=Tetrahymena thermophila (strain SB210) TaxID=312017 RepID=I7M0M3_TETTS|nr:transmembrane protein, putative [Tetrahymena thermophila SB210]EAR89388.2 transmembrane protein, putative [Tetrahymena thermophila SB210]|eukprot:XP_001009633.2 transmembrane protein, putative [Tetrahymena thermophila SB210]
MYHKLMNMLVAYISILNHFHKFYFVQSVNGYDCSGEISSLKSNSNIMCAMEFFKLKDITPLKDDKNLSLPENCYQITLMSGMPFIGGNSCDFTKPLQLTYNNSTYYASKVSIQQKYVVVAKPQCPQQLEINISINQFSFFYNQTPPYKGPGFCDYYSNNFFQTTDSLNSQTLSISLSVKKPSIQSQIYIVLSTVALVIMIRKVALAVWMGITQIIMFVKNVTLIVKLATVLHLLIAPHVTKVVTYIGITNVQVVKVMVLILKITFALTVTLVAKLVTVKVKTIVQVATKGFKQ